MTKPLLFSINTNTPDGVTVTPVDADKVNPLPDNLQCCESFSMNQTLYLIAFEKSSGIVHTYQTFNDDGTFLKEVAQSKIAINATLVAILNSGQSPLCLAYDSASGIVLFLQIAADFSLNTAFTLNAGPGISTLATFIYRGDLFLVAYNMNTGNVTKYQVLTGASPNSISANAVWTAKWAQTWTRFSFFQMGAENFFIKTNLNHSKVNIDHFMDDPNEGSHPVLDIDAPSQMIGLNNVNAFTDPKGFPYFSTYRSNGEITINQIYGNCLGWDIESQFTTDANRELMLAFSANNENYLLLY